MIGLQKLKLVFGQTELERGPDRESEWELERDGQTDVEVEIVI